MNWIKMITEDKEGGGWKNTSVQVQHAQLKKERGRGGEGLQGQ